jgi:hypothetical protein
MRISLGGVMLMALAAAAVAFAAAPWFAFRSLRDAARSGDVEALAQLVDYPAVRRDLAAQLSGLPMPSQPAPTLWTNPIGAIKDAFTPKPPEPPRVERYVSPPGLAALADGLTPGANLPPVDKEPFPMVAFWGPSRCRITVADPAAPEHKTGFTFTRRGVFEWKLARIELPGRKAQAASGKQGTNK